jgi:hypothetical protein
VPTALVISDYPIVSSMAGVVFRARYEIELTSWTEFVSWTWSGHSGCRPDVVVADITGIHVDAAMDALRHLPAGTSVFLCSLHENEVRVFRIAEAGPETQPSLPTLMAAAT